MIIQTLSASALANASAADKDELRALRMHRSNGLKERLWDEWQKLCFAECALTTVGCSQTGYSTYAATEHTNALRSASMLALFCPSMLAAGCVRCVCQAIHMLPASPNHATYGL